MHTVMGLRARRQRAALVAHPDGELYRRMSEGTDLIPLAPRNEIDLAAAWRLSRVLKQLSRTSSMRTILTVWPWPRPRSRSPRRHRCRRWSRLDASSFESRATRSRNGSTRQVDCFVAISEAVRERLVADGIPRSKTTVVHEGVDVERIVHLRPANVHAAFFLPTHAPIVGNIGALVPQKGQQHLDRCRGDRRAGGARRRASSSAATASCGQRWRNRSSASISSGTCSSPDSAPTCWSC